MIASLTFAFVLLAPTGVMAPAQECELDCMTDTPADQQAIADFRAAAEEYATLHRRLERALMLDHYASWPEEGDMESETLADVIRAARPDGRAGAFFKPTIRELIRFRLGRKLWVERYHTGEALAARAGTAELPRVYDWWFGDPEPEPWQSLLWELPALPEVLEYRFSGRHLVLVDTHAGLVMDVLENALPER
jgi:hypothetical protein